MSETIVQKLSRFGSLVVAHFKGDNDEVIRIKNEKRAQNNINQQIGALTNQLETQKDRVEAAQEKFDAVFAPASLITDAQAYISNLAIEQGKLKSEKKAQVNLEESIAFYQGLLEDFKVQA